MTLFVDASAQIAVSAGEPDEKAFSTALRDEGDLMWSAISCWKTISGLRSSRAWPNDVAQQEVELIVSQLPFRLVPIGEAERVAALDAYQRYGKGFGHQAKLNMGDCFAYACAKTNGTRLLHKGDDFAGTDMA